MIALTERLDSSGLPRVGARLPGRLRTGGTHLHGRAIGCLCRQDPHGPQQTCAPKELLETRHNFRIPRRQARHRIQRRVLVGCRSHPVQYATWGGMKLFRVYALWLDASCLRPKPPASKGEAQLGSGPSCRASVKDTKAWQFAFLPRAPQYWGATPTEWLPFLGSAVSSMIR